MNLRAILIGSSFALFLTPTWSFAVLLWGIDASKDGLSIIDSQTGAHSFVGRLHPDLARFTTPVTVATRPSDGAVFIRNNSPSQDQGLAMVDPNTGLATHLFSGVIGELAFGYNDVFFTQMVGPILGATGPLATIDLDTGSVISLGGPAITRVIAFGFNPADGFLYGAAPIDLLTGVQNLLKINSTTGAIVSSVQMTGVGQSGISGLTFDQGGNGLVSATPGIRDLNVGTGVVSNSRGYIPVTSPFQGLALIVPEPSRMVLIALSLALSTLPRRRVKRRAHVY